MAETTYDFTISTDFPGGAVNTTKFRIEIQASAIETALETINTTGDDIDVVFKAALSAGDETILHGDTTGPAGGLIAAHDNTPSSSSIAHTEIDLKIGGPLTIVEGVAASFGASGAECKRIPLVFPVVLNLQQVKINWKNAEIGDYGWLVLENPAADTSPQSALSVDDTQVTVGTGFGPYYAPANGAVYMEFWNDADDDIVEMREIDSVAGDVVTLKEGVGSAHSTSAKLRAIFQSFSLVRGTMKTDGGFRMVDNGSQSFGYEHEATNPIPAGVSLSGRFRSTSTPVERKAAVNYKLRIPAS